jgi:UTP--glucose-1-phosphate uridylyltransferase
VSVSKAILPAAGFGTRMLPAAKAVPKELLPVLDRPVIQYVVQEAAGAGIDDLLLITSRHKRAIEDHFDHDAELEARLKSAGKQNLLAELTALTQRIRIHSVRQGHMRGLGDAVRCARAFCADRPFLCLLGDAIFSGGRPPAEQLISAFDQLQTPVIGLERVPTAKVDRYGIVSGKRIGPDLIRIEGVVEKPSPRSAPSRLAIAARYVLTPEIFDCLDQTAPGAGGEIQLTDALRRLLKIRPVHGVILEARRHDIGDPADWLATNLLLAAADPALWRRLRPLLKSLLK